MIIGKVTLGVSDPSPRPGLIAQGFSTRKIDPCYLWLYKPVGIGAVEKTAGFLLLKFWVHKHTHSGIHHWGNSWKGTSCTWEGVK